MPERSLSPRTKPRIGASARVSLAQIDGIDSLRFIPQLVPELLEHQNLAGMDWGHDRVVAHDGFVARVSVVVDDLNILGPGCRPPKADTPLLTRLKTLRPNY
jgi:hypothetical protein